MPAPAFWTDTCEAEFTFGQSAIYTLRAWVWPLHTDAIIVAVVTPFADTLTFLVFVLIRARCATGWLFDAEAAIASDKAGFTDTATICILDLIATRCATGWLFHAEAFVATLKARFTDALTTAVLDLIPSGFAPFRDFHTEAIVIAGVSAFADALATIVFKLIRAWFAAARNSDAIAKFVASEPIAADTIATTCDIFVRAGCAATAWRHAEVRSLADIISTADAAIIAGANLTFARNTAWVRHNNRRRCVITDAAAAVPFCIARTYADTIFIHDHGSGALIFIAGVKVEDGAAHGF